MPNGMLFGKPDNLLNYNISDQKVNFRKFQIHRRGFDKSLNGFRFQDKAEIKYDFELLTDSENKTLDRDLNNRDCVHEGYITAPVPFQDSALDFAGVTGPSSTNVIKHINESKTVKTAPTAGGWTEISTADYNKVDAFDANILTPGATAGDGFVKRVLIGFKINAFNSSFGYDILDRLTLSIFGVRGQLTNLHVWSKSAADWYFLRKLELFNSDDLPNNNFYWAGQFGIPATFKTFATDFIDSDFIYFRLESDIADASGGVPGDIDINYLQLFPNGFWVDHSGDKEFNFRTTNTNAGRKGDLNLIEF